MLPAIRKTMLLLPPLVSLLVWISAATNLLVNTKLHQTLSENPWSSIQFNCAWSTAFPRHKSALCNEMHLQLYCTAVVKLYNFEGNDTINWEACQCIIKTKPTTTHFLLNFMSGHFPTHAQQCSMKCVPTTHPLCNEASDNQLHYLRCLKLMLHGLIFFFVSQMSPFQLFLMLFHAWCAISATNLTPPF